MLWFLLACINAPPEQMALDKDVTLTEALAACAKLSTPVKRGRCSLDALNVRDAISPDQCTVIPGERWQSECMFQAAERSTGTLQERYAICALAGDYARECGFHLWQQALMELKPGAEHKDDGLLIRAGQLMRKHRSYAEPLDYSYEETFWTWFWGAWWEQQAEHQQNDFGACVRWTDSSDRKQCQNWASKAHVWMKTREVNRPR
jgi:hypothetical protein